MNFTFGLIQKGEGLNLELKREWAQDKNKFLKTVSAFSNTSGGFIVFGVDDKKKVVEEVAQNGKAIRGLLGNRIRHQMRVVPELRFIEDDSLDYIENIDNLLHPDK